MISNIKEITKNLPVVIRTNPKYIVFDNSELMHYIFNFIDNQFGLIVEQFFPFDKMSARSYFYSR